MRKIIAAAGEVTVRDGALIAGAEVPVDKQRA